MLHFNPNSNNDVLYANWVLNNRPYNWGEDPRELSDMHKTYLTIWVLDVDCNITELQYPTTELTHEDLKSKWAESNDILLSLLVHQACRWAESEEQAIRDRTYFSTWSVWSEQPYLKQIVLPHSDYLFRQFHPSLIAYGMSTEEDARAEMYQHNPGKFVDLDHDLEGMFWD